MPRSETEIRKILVLGEIPSEANLASNVELPLSQMKQGLPIRFTILLLVVLCKQRKCRQPKE